MATTPPGARSRLELLELRAKRARRRLRLTLALLVVSAATWAAVVLTPLLWFAGLVPTAMLLAVLVLGRAAAAAARQADARWAAERRAAERKALQVRALAAGGPQAPINRARITGRAVHGSSTMTQMIPKVAIKVVEGDVDPAPAATVVEPVETTPERAPSIRDAATEAIPSTSKRPPMPARPAMPAPPAPDVPTSGTWEPRPVPLPTYVTKPAAPRREPRPLTGMTPPVSTGWSSSPWQRVEDAGEQVGEADTSWSLGSTQDAALGRVATPAPATASDTQPGSETSSGDVLATEEPRPRTETLGLPLEQILARRRAAG